MSYAEDRKRPPQSDKPLASSVSYADYRKRPGDFRECDIPRETPVLRPLS